MVCPEGCGLLHQATPDSILKHCDCPFYLPIGFAVTNGDVVVDSAQIFAEPCKAACKYGTVVCPDIALFAPTGNQVIIQELSSPLAV